MDPSSWFMGTLHISLFFDVWNLLSKKLNIGLHTLTYGCRLFNPPSWIYQTYLFNKSQLRKVNTT